MPKIALNLDLKQLEQMISQLGMRDRIALVRHLERKTWGEQFHALVAKIDKRRRKYPISRKEALNLAAEARKERYAASRS